MWAKLWIYTGNGTHDAWPSHETLAAELGCTTRSVRRILEELEQVGALSIRLRAGTSNLYTLHWQSYTQANGTTDKIVRPTQDKNVLPPRTNMSYKERQSEIENQDRGQQDKNVHRRTPGDAPLTREQIRQIRAEAARQVHPK